MSQEIYDYANKLERAIRSLQEYKTVQEAKIAINEDSEAKELFDEFVAMQEKLQMMMQTGQMPSTEEQTAIQELGKKIEGNPVIKAYFDAQQKLSVYVSDIERIVFGPLNDLVK